MELESLLREISTGRPSAFTWSEEQLHIFVETGALSVTNTRLSKEERELRLGGVVDWMSFVSGDKSLNAVYMDTTTLHTALAEVHLGFKTSERWGITAAALFDLSTFVNAAVMFDHVFCLENENFDPIELNELLGNEPIVIDLPLERFGPSVDNDHLNSPGGLLREFWMETTEHIDDLKSAWRNQRSPSPELEEALEIRKAWKTILEFDDRPELWFDEREVVLNFTSDGPALLREIAGLSSYFADSVVATSLKESLPQRDEAAASPYVASVHALIAECDHRSHFNARVANSLNLPYLPNSFRLPFRGYLYRKAQTVQKLIPTLGIIDEEYSKVAETYSDDGALQLPFFLGVVLSQTTSLQDFCPAVAEVRRRASKFREHRRELDAEIQSGKGGKIVQRLQQAIRGEGEKLRANYPLAATAAVLLGVLPSLAGHINPILFGAVTALTMASKYRREDIERLKDRALRRQLWFLIDLQDTARELTNACPVVRKLWNVAENDLGATREQFVDAFSRLGTLSY